MEIYDFLTVVIKNGYKAKNPAFGGEFFTDSNKNN